MLRDKPLLPRSELIERIKQNLKINDEELEDLLENPPIPTYKEFVFSYMFNHTKWGEYAKIQEEMLYLYELKSRKLKL